MPAATPDALGVSDALSSRSRAATVMVMVTATWDAEVVAITTAGEEVAGTAMVGGIIAIAGEITH
jgi:hypothetical protein